MTYTHSQAMSKARWVKRYVRGAYGVKVVTDLDSGESWVEYRNACGNARDIHNDDDFVVIRETEAQ